MVTVKVGFTGSRDGLTNDQTLQVHMLLGDLKSAGVQTAIHGMCVGADAQFHFMAKALGYTMIGMPGVTKTGFPWNRADFEGLVTREAKPFLDRNKDIVSEADVMIACPKETTEVMRGSGTWATIRYARRVGRPLCIVWPDGTGVVEKVGDGMTLDQYRAVLTT